MQISVAYAAGETSFWTEMELSETATVEDAIERSGFRSKFTELDLDKLKVGIFGKVCPRSTELKEGDRVEIYQPLQRVMGDEDDEDDE